MITNSFISPHPSLNGFINRYVLCESEPGSVNLTFPLFANHESCIYFSLGDLPKRINDPLAKNEIKPMNRVSLFGLLTYSYGSIQLEGSCTAFIIEFRPNGFSTLFGIKAGEISGNDLPANEVLGRRVEDLSEQLHGAVNIQEMAIFADKFLAHFLHRKKSIYINEGLTTVATKLLTTSTNTDIPRYAAYANMSTRNFERKFIEQVGVSPKTFCRLVRFQAAVQHKVAHPKVSWTSIAYECGYYDSTHLVKEFKQFASLSPSGLFNHYPGLMDESFNSIERYDC